MRKFMAIGIAAAAIGVCLGSCRGIGENPLEVTKGTVIRNVTVVDTRGGSLQPRMTIVLDEGKIQRIAAHRVIRTSGAAQSIDASGKYVVPGFLDMHTHAMSEADRQPTIWPLLIANGITGIREMSGSAELIRRAQQLNADRAAGRVDAPEVVQIAGDVLGGITSPSVAVERVQQQKAMGADFVKLVNANREATLAIIAEARKLGLDVAGHLPPAVGAAESSAAGWRAIEHLGAGMTIALDCAADEAGIRLSILKGAGAKPAPPTLASIVSPMLSRALDAPFYQRAFDTYSDRKCEALAQTFARNGTWHVPTLIRLRTMIHSDDPQLRADPNLAYVERAKRALWEKLAQDYSTGVPMAAAATFREYYGLQRGIVKLLKQNGVKMLAGSDLGGIWVIPGFGLHQEFRELAAAGLSPLEVLQMTTLNAAEFLGREATMGTVEEGKHADLVLLDANPLENVANLQRISAVFLRGKHFPRETLDRLKREVAASHASPPALPAR